MGKHLAFRELGIDDAHWRSIAVNHWDVAVSCHRANFPSVDARQEDIHDVTAADFGLEQIDLLWASPSCIHFSRARAGKPKSNQQRAHAWEVVDRWLRVADVRVFLMENVPEFVKWGPLNAKGRPIKRREGEYFANFVRVLEALGYTVSWRILCAADYGDPTIRKRLFLQAAKDGVISWPEPTHRDPRQPVDFTTADRKPWRSAAECINWSDLGSSIFERKRPLADATCRRIAHGVVRYVLEAEQPFLVNLTHGGRLEPLDEPFRTITTANRGEKALVTPTLVQMRGTADDQVRGSARPVTDPIGTVSAGGVHHALASLVLSNNANNVPKPVSHPVPTVTTGNRNYLVSPTLIQTGYGERPGQSPRCLDIEQPLGTVVSGGSKHALVSAFLAKHYTGVVGQDMRAPMGTVTNVDHHSMVAATLVGVGGRAGQSQPRSVNSPLGTVTTKGDTAVVSVEARPATDADIERGRQVAAFLIEYYGTGGARSADSPLGTVTTLDRHGLVTVEIDGTSYAIIDIRMRMLEPRELARAMGFPESYEFVDADGQPLTKRDSVKIVGNACPVETVKALTMAVIRARPDLFDLEARDAA